MKTMAEQADRHILYQKSVQDPVGDADLIQEKFKEIRGRDAISFREDFCGTAILSVAWCQSNGNRTAQGVDLCEETLEWGRRNNIEPAGQSVAERVELIHANVLDVQSPEVDVTCAFNFSYCIFKDRDSLRSYFQAARKGLNDDGILMLDIYGGPDSIDVLEEEREVDGEEFTYIWDQEKYNPVDHNIICNIHFHFPDDSRIEQAFHYDWRLWTIPELKELLLEAGFSKVRVYWEEYEDTDDDNEYLEGTGRYIEVTEVDNQEAWIAYIVAEV
jgi:hypothetical protein